MLLKCDIEINYKKYSLGTSFRYNDFMKNIDLAFTDPIIGNYIPDINELQRKFTNGDFIIDLRTSYQYNNFMKFSLIINNLLNREYMTRPSRHKHFQEHIVQCNIKI